MLHGEGEYNLDDIKLVEVTKSYLGLDQHIRGCQDNEPLYNCTTRHLIDEYLEKCHCLPFNLISHLRQVGNHQLKHI